MLRRRAWALDVLPSPDINLQNISEVATVDTGKMWASGYVPHPLHTAAPDSEMEIEFEAPFDDAFDEVTVHCCEETVHSHN